MKRFITEKEITDLHRSGNKTLVVEGEYALTPLAADKLNHWGIKIIKKEDIELSANNTGFEDKVNFPPKKIVFACDHTGFEAKGIIMPMVEGKGIEVIDAGTYSEESCDYPDFAFAAAKHIFFNEADMAVIIDATGSPSAISANKIPGIRAAVCYNEFTAHSAREHNNSNILCMGARALGIETLKSIVLKFISTPFAAGRHQRRLDKISDVENKLLGKNIT